MSREQYTPPTLTQPSITSNPPSTTNPAGPPSSAQNPPIASGANPGAGSSTAYAAFNITGANTFEDSSRPVHYLCGDCDSKVVLKKTDPIRCKECGYRVLYKERTNRYVSFFTRFWGEGGTREECWGGWGECGTGGGNWGSASWSFADVLVIRMIQFEAR
ncbi:hypothetical protein B0A54_05268 [Friedmanniomyces endolithicus]|uniref:DNA-directed RNA polymerases I, II, and III subunit RPABC4 n=1 Tax=Friedmanniomyces endolithicus TaxID=329885 RepID=A0A4U0V6J4_9PEZI|nr:hypothetical protein B0A54_05268 [Friedmanniomyces endolithicus]